MGNLFKSDCGCYVCDSAKTKQLWEMKMILCAKCGNKRCPHATDHRNACTGSNEAGQPGSRYGGPGENDGRRGD